MSSTKHGGFDPEAFRALLEKIAEIFEITTSNLRWASEALESGNTAGAARVLSQAIASLEMTHQNFRELEAFAWCASTGIMPVDGESEGDESAR